MGGEVNWTALPYVCELYGINDIELFLINLTTIRDHGNGG